MSHMEVHADDYGISLHASKDILSCIKAGKLDSISVITNMSAYDEAAKELVYEMSSLEKRPLLTVHLNFLEGHCCANVEDVPHLVNEKGYFSIGWGTLFKWNFSTQKETIKRELKAEVKAQTKRFLQYFSECGPLRFDGHQHTQMIPLVYNALLEVIQEEAYEVSYIRVTREPMRAYLKAFSLWTSYKPINWVKNVLLNLLATGLELKLNKMNLAFERDSHGELRDTVPCRRMYLWGVVMSGCMNEQRVHKLLGNMTKQAKNRNRHLEILFHPGSLVSEEMGEEFCDLGANKFHLSKNRSIEFEAVMDLTSE